MNKNIDLKKILKHCPRGTRLYSTTFGYVNFKMLIPSSEYPIIVYCKDEINEKSFTVDGKFMKNYDAECTLFPSKDQRDWSKFTAPWYQNEKMKKFDPRTLIPFDKILVRDSRIENWYAAQFSHIMYDLSEYEFDDCGEKVDFIICTTGSTDFNYCIPFNDDTKHLVGTTEDAPEVYKYWED